MRWLASIAFSATVMRCGWSGRRARRSDCGGIAVPGSRVLGRYPVMPLLRAGSSHSRASTLATLPKKTRCRSIFFRASRISDPLVGGCVEVGRARPLTARTVAITGQPPVSRSGSPAVRRKHAPMYQTAFGDRLRRIASEKLHPTVRHPFRSGSLIREGPRPREDGARRMLTLRGQFLRENRRSESGRLR